MFAVFQYAFNTVAPIVILGAIGYLVKTWGWFTPPMLKAMNKFNFRFGLCALMFYNVYNAESTRGLSWRLVAVMFTILGALTVIGIVTANLVTMQRNRKGILVQAAFRSNYAIIGIPIVAALTGDSAVGLASLFQIPCVIYYNGMSVLLLLHYAQDKDDSGRHFGKTLKGLLTNPLIDGLLAGCLVLLIRSWIPIQADGELAFSLQRDLPWLYQSVKYLANMSTPLAIIVLGAQMDFASIAGFKRELIAGVLLRLIGAPVVGYSILFGAGAMGILTLQTDIVALSTAILGAPMAAASVVMASEMQGDDQLCGQIVAWTSVLGMFSLFMIVAILRAAGWL